CALGYAIRRGKPQDDLPRENLPLSDHFDDQLREMKAIMESDASVDGVHDGTFSTTSFWSTEKLLVGGEATTDSQPEHPPPSHVLCLWQVFLDRVNPVTKLIHVPSVQPYLAQATAPWPWLPENIEVLLFAIYAVAVVALDDNECISMLGSPKNTLFQRYTSTLRSALHRARFLKTTDIVILQALTLHLVRNSIATADYSTLWANPGIEDIITSMEQNAVSSGTGSRGWGAKLDKLAAGVEGHLDRLIQQYSDPTAGPLHQDASQIKFAMTTKVRKMCQQPWKQLETGSQPTVGNDHLFRLSIDAIEHVTGLYQAMATKNLLWFVSTLFESELFTYLVGELHSRTSGVLVERAWGLIPVIYHYHQDLFDLSIELNVVLTSFVLKAWGKRKGILEAKFGHGVEAPAYVQRLEKSMPLRGVSTGPLSSMPFPPPPMALGFSGAQDMPWDPRSMGFMKEDNFGDSPWTELQSDMHRHVLGSGEETDNTLPGDCLADPQAPW
ncbi:unnamed protein product, partial [Clonostachys rhizophaga]